MTRLTQLVGKECGLCLVDTREYPPTVIPGSYSRFAHEAVTDHALEDYHRIWHVVIKSGGKGKA